MDSARVRVEKVLAFLTERGPASVNDLIEALGFTRVQVEYALRRARDKNMARISHWERGRLKTSGPVHLMSMWVAGSGEDSPRPSDSDLDWWGTLHLQNIYVGWTRSREVEELGDE